MFPILLLIFILKPIDTYPFQTFTMKRRDFLKKGSLAVVALCTLPSLSYGAYTIDSDQCIVCGTCADECPVEAIFLDGDIYAIDLDSCTDCGTCVDVCPTEAISAPASNKTYVINSDCVACGQCVDECARNAISEGTDIYSIDTGLCSGCGVCADVCPTVAIHPA